MYPTAPFAFSFPAKAMRIGRCDRSLKPRRLSPIQMNIIEVERRFSLSPPVKQKLLRTVNDELVSTRRVHDEYHGEELAVADRWLRRRNGVWELKVPINCSQDFRALGSATYRELTGASVWSELGIPPVDCNISDGATLACYAELDTVRTSFILPFENVDVNVTLDECTSPNGFSCSVGEIELLVHTEEEISPATQILSRLFKFLNVEHLQDNEGKLVRYIRIHRPDLYDRLLETLKL